MMYATNVDLNERFKSEELRICGWEFPSFKELISAKAHQQDKLERLCHYIARPAVSEKRLSLTSTGKVRYELKTPYRNGTTHVILNRWILLRVWLSLCPSPGSISPDFTVCSRPTANTVFMSRQLSEGNEERKQPRISPGMRRPQRNAMPQ
jgi:hypothetical protein